MPLLSIARFFTTLLSLAILVSAGYLLWTWGQGEWAADAAGELRLVRDDWRLFIGLGLLAWSFLGRFVVVLLAARRDDRPTRALHREGQLIAGATGSMLHVETYGPAGAPPLIFTHGWGMDSTFWNYAKQDLGDRFRLILWDLPGLGRSKAFDDGSIKLQSFARDLLGLRLAGVVLLNTTYTNSLRTMVLSGLLTALQKPVLEPVMKVTRWLQPVVWLSKWQSYLSGSSHLAQRLGFGKFVTRSQLEHATLLSTRSPPAVEAQGNLAMLNWDATGALNGSPVPVLVVGGDRDIVTKLEASQAIARDASDGDLRTVADVNHMGPMERADLYNALIAEFALRVQPSATVDLRAPPTSDGVPAPLPPTHGNPDRPVSL